MKGFSFCNYFVLDKFLYKLCLTGVKEKICKERGTICSHMDADDWLKNVPATRFKCKTIKHYCLIFKIFTNICIKMEDKVKWCHLEAIFLR
jgi:hypothetical protein